MVVGTNYDKDPYAVLGVPRDADAATIKKAYRALALQHHPDRWRDPGERAAAADRFADIAGAYEILTDEQMRREWDRAATAAGRGSDAAHPGGPAGRRDRKGTGESKLPKFKFNPSDPYEVWKKDFEDQFGRPYPGAAGDVVSLDTHIYQKRKGPATVKRIDKRKSTMNTQTTGRGEEQPTAKGMETKQGLVAEGRSDDKEKKKGILAWLLCKKYQDTSQHASPKRTQITQPNAAKESTAKRKTRGTALVMSGKQKSVPSKETALAVRNNQRRLIERELEPAGHDNRPISMEVTVEEGADGSTITTTTMTRPDGTVEKCIQRTGVLGRKPLQLEAGKAKLAIERDKRKLVLDGQGASHLAIENGK